MRSSKYRNVQLSQVVLQDIFELVSVLHQRVSALPKNNEVKILCSTGHHGTFPISLWTVTVHCDQGKRP